MLPQPRYLNLEYFFNLIYEWLTGQHLPPGELGQIWRWIQAVSAILVPLFLVGIIYLTYKIMSLRRAEFANLRRMLEDKQLEKPEKNEEWEQVLAHLSSDNPNDWKAAVIDADKILDEVVRRFPTTGETLGERLKNIEPSDFNTLSQAWEAHRVRNRIAHESDFVLTRREARRAIDNYRAVFEEFGLL